MPKVDAAQQAVVRLRAPDWADQLLAVVSRLPKALRGPGRALLGRDARGRPFDVFDADVLAEAGEQMDALKKKERLRLFEVLFPRIAEPVNAGWRLAKRLPYQVGIDRK